MLPHYIKEGAYVYLKTLPCDIDPFWARVSKIEQKKSGNWVIRLDDGYDGFVVFNSKKNCYLFGPSIYPNEETYEQVKELDAFHRGINFHLKHMTYKQLKTVYDLVEKMTKDSPLGW